MAFTPKTWVAGEVITATELNRVETGVNDAHAGNIDPGAIGTTEIADAAVTTAKVANGAVTSTKLASDALDRAAGFAVGISTFSLTAGSSVLVPAGWWYVSINTPADMVVEVQQATGGSWGALSSGTSAVHLVASDGVSVRVRNAGAVTRSGSRRQVFP